MKLSILINMDWQSCNGLRKNPDAGIDCSHLHGRSFIHRLARGGLAQEETVAAAVGAVGGLIPGME